VIERIRRLAIPPAWTDVWICPRATGHIQATGRDVKGRKQYRYHADWSTARSETKFDRLPAFARALPKLRKRVDADLGKRGQSRDKVLATAVRLLEITLIRVGNAQYAKQNRSYGLTTLMKRHLEVGGAALTFEFKGKSGVDHKVSVRDRRLATVVRSLRELPGQHLFKYRTADGDLCPITSDDVNAYIREAMGDGFSAKDFRTWAGTVSAARALRDMEPATSPTDAKRRITVCVKAVRACWAIPRPSAARPMSIRRCWSSMRAATSARSCRAPDTAGFEKALVKVLTHRITKT
jgi:DNA topoisomerase-1